jgi:hypothetical protein
MLLGASAEGMKGVILCIPAGGSFKVRELMLMPLKNCLVMSLKVQIILCYTKSYQEKGTKDETKQWVSFGADEIARELGLKTIV